MRMVIFAFWLLAGICSCRHAAVDGLLEDAGAEMDRSPGRVLAALDSVRPEQLPRVEQQARFALLYTQARDKCGYDDIGDSLIVRAVNYYERHGAVRERALAHYYHGRILSNVGDAEGAAEAYLKAAASAGKSEDPYLQGLIDNAVGQLYSSQGFFAEAAACYETAAAHFRRAEASRNEGLVLENLGYMEYLLGDLAEAGKVPKRTIFGTFFYKNRLIFDYFPPGC